MFCKKNWLEIKNSFEAWWKNEPLDRPLIQVSSPRKNVLSQSGYSVWDIVHNLDNFGYVLDKFERFCDETYFGGDAIPNLFVNFGPGVMSAYISGNLNIKEDTVWFETPMEWNEIYDRLKYDSENKWWKLTKEITSLATERCENKFFVSITDLGGNMDILASLRGTERLLLDLVDSPDKVKYCLSKINELWFKYYDELCSIIKKSQEGTTSWMDIWCPERHYPLQCDFSYMISPKMFEELVLPYLIEQCEYLNYSIYHWDGPGQIPHLDLLLSIGKLTGIQWVPGAGAPTVTSEKWFPYYSKILKSGKTLVLPGVEPEKVKRLIKHTGQKGILIQTIACNSEPQAENLLNELLTEQSQ
ncbi:MAG: hypothetical protein AUJ85_10510 [Elusimicrobia bacterium CG1_02_37_114]|nr:MAG: hypothetical protein AUJ85_10510 [Elusimicrobia bacterium CG1_02_37_114]PIV52216.1 MAG: hypothetical protein COS17_10330 [Elusimicrobia bacterium CG02_land_8_20_14_3_00_37_13]PIZ12428.1 MAG: hypothetical protein COY53_10095 [Elusimicrobia bacterium CG_4_10_14_0_8_um_filter_37_32]